MKTKKDTNLNDDLNNFNEVNKIDKNDNNKIVYLNIPQYYIIQNEWKEVILNSTLYKNYSNLINNTEEIINKYKLNFDQITNTLFDFNSDFTFNKSIININEPNINKGLIYSRGYNIFDNNNSWIVLSTHNSSNLIKLNLEQNNIFNIYEVFKSNENDILDEKSSYFNMRLLCYWLNKSNRMEYKYFPSILDYSWLFKKNETHLETKVNIIDKNFNIEKNIETIKTYNTKYLKIFYINFESFVNIFNDPKKIKDELVYFYELLCKNINDKRNNDKRNNDEYLNIENIPIYIKDENNIDLLNEIDKDSIDKDFPKFILINEKLLINNIDFNREIILIETNEPLKGKNKMKYNRFYKFIIEKLNDSFTKKYKLIDEKTIEIEYNSIKYIIFVKDIYKEYPTTCQFINYKNLCFNIRKHKLIPPNITKLNYNQEKKLIKNLFNSYSKNYILKLPKINGIYTYNDNEIKPDPLSTFFGWHSNSIIKFNSFNKTHYKTVINNTNYTNILPKENKQEEEENKQEEEE